MVEDKARAHIGGRALAIRGQFGLNICRRTDRAPCVSGSGWQIRFFEWSSKIYFAVGDRVHRAATRQREIWQWMSRVKCVEQRKKSFLVHRLNGASDILVFLF